MKKEFVAKVVAVQQKLVAVKGKYNSFGGYKYRSCEDILESVKPILKEEGLILTINDSIEQVGDRYYVKATATITDGEDSISSSAYAREALEKTKFDEPQVTGSSSTYARKYALGGLLCNDNSDDDPDVLNNNEEYTQKAKPTTSTPKSTAKPVTVKPAVTKPKTAPVEAEKQEINLDNMIGDVEVKKIEKLGEKWVSYIITRYNVKTLSELTMEQYKEIVKIYKDFLTKKQQAEESKGE